MKIGNRLTLQFSIIVATILILFSTSIYYFSYNFQKNQFYFRLKDRAITTARLLVAVNEINKDLLKLIDKNTNILPKEQVEIFNINFERVYNSRDNDSISINKELLKIVLSKKEIHFKDDYKDAIIILFTYDKKNYIIIASAYDIFGISKLNNLKLLLLIGLFISMIITILVGRFYSKQSLYPIIKVITQVDNITASNLDSKVDEGNKKDEIAMLAITFNNMLKRLDKAFEMQRNFALNASHELRTPLTSITGQIEIALMKKRNIPEYEEILTSIHEDIKNLNELSNGLLDLAHTSIDKSSLNIKEIRIDEIVLQTQTEILKRNNQYNISFNFDKLPEDENKLKVIANEYLLKIAFTNIIDNACKFSNNKSVSIKIDFDFDSVLLKFIDNGPGIPKEDINNVFLPFFRSINTKNKVGFGIGLPLVKKIINIHNGSINISSEINIGTNVIIKLPFKKH